MISEYWFQPRGGYFIPTWGKLAIIAMLLGVSIVVSMVLKKGARE
jgi:hypothetical protein